MMMKMITTMIVMMRKRNLIKKESSIFGGDHNDYICDNDHDNPILGNMNHDSANF